MCWTAPCCALAEHHDVVAQQARDEQQQQRDGRREGRTHHGQAHVLAPPPRASRASRPTGVCHRAKWISIYLEASAPSRRPLPREDSDATGTAHDALLGTERSQGHRTSTLGCLDECQPGSGWHARCDCVAVAASHGCSADEATHHQKQVPRLPSKRARHFYPRR